ncbi:hypothetical protein V144x_17000 [Gimesia aquarii]|uniref:Uncharacterized protein n=1 Tax=Gimesia aquarii TaxID=2527964 RepID=A0A517VTA4_9PLAN|nr:hypothetical protein V144x_17000 [Gimesia aquarii]
MPVWVLTDHSGTGIVVPFLMWSYTTRQLLKNGEQTMKCWANIDSHPNKST